MNEINKYSPRPGKISGYMAALVFFAAVACLLYYNSAHGSFILDDHGDIVDNSAIHVADLSFQSVRDAVLNSPCINRPVANLSFALGYYFHGLDPFWFRAVNIVIHIFTAFFLFLLFQTTLDLLPLKNKKTSLAPFFGAAIFLVHPVNTQAVSYIVQRMTSMAAMFYVLSMLCYVKGRLALTTQARALLFIAAACFFLLAAGSKEIAATLPFAIVLYEWFFLRKWGSNSILPRAAAPFAAVLAFGALAGVFAYFHPAAHGGVFSFFQEVGGDHLLRIFSQFRAVGLYITLLLFPLPSRLNLDHDFAASKSLIDPASTLAWGVILCSLALWAIFTAKRRNLLSFAVLFFLMNLVIESGVPGIEQVFEHRIYLPAMFLYFAAAYWVLDKPKNNRAAIILLAAVCVLLCIGTWERNKAWSSQSALWADCVRKSPNKSRPHYNLGAALAQSGDVAGAMESYGKAIALDPDNISAHINLGKILSDSGKPEQALQHLLTAVNINPRSKTAHLNAGSVLLELNSLDGAVSHFRAAIAIDPYYARAYNNLAVAYAGSGKIPLAIEQMEKSVLIDPDSFEARINLARMLVKDNRKAEAAKHFKAAVKMHPELKDSVNELAPLLDDHPAAGEN